MGTDMDTDEFITATMRRVADSATPPLGDPLKPAQTRRWVAPLAVAAAIAVVASAAGAVVIGRDDPVTVSPAGPVAPTTGCQLDYEPAPLPEWARAGFTPPDQAMPFVLGDRGDLVAILWDAHHPLEAPPAADENNKILWVARIGATDGPLKITATLGSTGETVTRTVAPAPGPSGIDLPSAGCWSLDLTWGGQHDHLMLGYAPG